MKTQRTASKQAELILRLYELRHKTVMHGACSFVGGPFLPMERAVRLHAPGTEPERLEIRLSAG